MASTRRWLSPALAFLLVIPFGLFGRAAAASELRVYVVVLDGLNPAEVRLVLTPTVWEMRQRGTWYEQARATMGAETIPNHVSMMTGALPERSGVPGNTAWLPDVDATPRPREVSNPDFVTATTLFQMMHAQCAAGVRSAASLSKTYLHSVFGGALPATDPRRPDQTWTPSPVIPVSNHAPDVATILAARAQVDAEDPALLFVNLGDIDRSGHADETGPSGVPAFRTAVIEATDALLRDFVAHLKERGTWGDTILLLVSDHGMDYSTPDHVVSLQTAYEADAGLRGKTLVVQNGGMDLVYLRDAAAPDANATLNRARDVALEQAGVDASGTFYRVDNPADPGHAAPDAWGVDGTRRAGDLIASAKLGYRFAEPSATSNPIPGNHGGIWTRHNIFLVTGGSALVTSGAYTSTVTDPVATDPAQAQSADVAPTVAWLLGLDTPAAGFQGRALREAFNATAVDTAPKRC